MVGKLVIRVGEVVGDSVLGASLIPSPPAVGGEPVGYGVGGTAVGYGVGGTAVGCGVGGATVG